MRKIISVLFMMSALFAAFASVDYGLSVNTDYNTDSKALELSFVPYLEVDSFKFYLRAPWTPNADGKAGFDDFFKFDSTNFFTTVNSVTRYIHTISYGDMDEDLYIGFEREVDFDFDNLLLPTNREPRGITFQILYNSPYMNLKTFVDDFSFSTIEDPLEDVLSSVSEDHEYRKNMMGMEFRLAPPRVSSFTIGTGVLYTLESRYFKNDGSFSFYHYFAPQFDVSYNELLTKTTLFRARLATLVNMPYFHFSNYDIENDLTQSVYKNILSFVIEASAGIEAKDFDVRLSLFTSQKSYLYRRDGKDAFYKDGEYYSNIPGSAYGFAFDIEYKVGRKGKIDLSFVLPFDLHGKFDLFKYDGKTYDDFIFNFSFGKSIRVYGGLEVEGFIGHMINKESILHIFNQTSSNVHVGVEFDSRHFVAFCQATLNSINPETKHPDISFSIGIHAGSGDFFSGDRK